MSSELAPSFAPPVPSLKAAERAVGELRSRLAPFLAPPPAGTAPLIVVVSSLAVVVVGFALAVGVGQLGGALVALLVAATLAEALPVPIEKVAAGATSFANIFIVAAATLSNWRVGALVGALSMLVVELYRRRSLATLAYNTSLYALAGAAAGLLSQSLPEQYRNGLAASLAFYLVDVALLAAVIAHAEKKQYLSVALRFYGSTLVPFGVMAATTAMLVYLWRESPFVALLLLPPVVAVVSYQRSLLKAFERQRELDRLKDEFIAVVSHELRTPLAAVYVGATTLAERELDDEAQRRVIAIIRSEGARLKKLIDDVLWASRLDAGAIKRGEELCDPVEIVSDVMAAAPELASGDVIVVANVADDLPAVAGNPEHLRRVLANLVDNAVKYSPGGGTVEVSAQRLNGRLRFTVKDEGTGIPEAEQERVFDKFARLDPHMKAGVGGTGLGLYICRELVEGMGGEIWVTNNDGAGAVFAFEIPVATKGEAT